MDLQDFCLRPPFPGNPSLHRLFGVKALCWWKTANCQCVTLLGTTPWIAIGALARISYPEARAERKEQDSALKDSGMIWGKVWGRWACWGRWRPEGGRQCLISWHQSGGLGYFGKAKEIASGIWIVSGRNLACFLLCRCSGQEVLSFCCCFSPPSPPYYPGVPGSYRAFSLAALWEAWLWGLAGLNSPDSSCRLIVLSDDLLRGLSSWPWLCWLREVSDEGEFARDPCCAFVSFARSEHYLFCWEKKALQKCPWSLSAPFAF